MEIITEFVQNQLPLVLPVALVILAGIFVFRYSLQPAKQPAFNLSALDDRKTAGKKKKLKEKRSTPNGVAPTVSKSDKSPVKEQKKSPEPARREKKDAAPKEVKKTEAPKKVLEPQESKKKTNRKVAVAKPADFDDGDWETVPSKADKKKKEQPTKKEKKSKSQTEVQNIKGESPEKDLEIAEVQIEAEPEPELEVEPVPDPEPEEIVVEEIEEPAPVIEEKKDKKKKKKANKVLQPEPEPEEVAPEHEPAAPQTVAAPVEQRKSATAPSGAAFDELGDTWTEAKTVKKSKKKARRDN